MADHARKDVHLSPSSDHGAAIGSSSGGTQADWQSIDTAPERRKVIVSWVNALGNRRMTFASFWPIGTLDMGDDVPEDDVDENGKNVYAGWWEESEANDDSMWKLTEPLTDWRPLPLQPRAAATGSPSSPGHGWQPIETAVKFPFESVLGTDGHQVRVTHWDDLDGRWIEDGPYNSTRRWEPTHWMPLPTPPLPASPVPEP